MLKRFILYGFCGWCVEVFWTGMASLLKGNVKLTSTTYLWMFPIYGLAAIFLEPIHNNIRSWPFYIRGGVYMILIFTVEYLSGLVLRMLLGVCPWDYSGNTFSVNGLIRLDYAPAWFTAGLLFEKLHDLLMKVPALRGQ